MPAEELPFLESECEDCCGKGWYWPEDSDDRANCPTCEGAGYVTTDFGERVLALMRHNFRPLLQEFGGDC